jgi:carbon storage regulator
VLVLSRKQGEVIYIGDSIKITVVDIDRGKIRLGICAPKEVPISRQELLSLREQDTIEARTRGFTAPPPAPDGVHHSDSSPVG